MGLELKCPLWYLYSSTLFFFFDCSLLLFFILTFLFPFLFLYEINSLNFFDDPILLPCNHLFCKYVFCFLILIWFLVFFFFSSCRCIIFCLPCFRSCMPFAAQIGSVCPLCKAGFVDRGRVSTTLRLLIDLYCFWMMVFMYRYLFYAVLISLWTNALSRVARFWIIPGFWSSKITFFRIYDTC